MMMRRQARPSGKRRIAQAAILLGFLPFPASAEIIVFKCEFPGVPGWHFTIYDDGTPARVGTGPGVGDQGSVVRDKRTGAMVIIEKNGDDFPITFTTISPSGDAVHSRADSRQSGLALAFR